LFNSKPFFAIAFYEEKMIIKPIYNLISYKMATKKKAKKPAAKKPAKKVSKKRK